MRYTTVIDLREYPQAYKSDSVRLLYLHLSLQAGYHEDDRDIVSTSIRRLAQGAGLTVSATRHAMHVLQAIGLLKRTSRGLLVTKWVASETVAARPKSQKRSADPSLDRLMREAEQKKEDYQRAVEKAVRELPLDELKAWAQELQEGRRTRHGGVIIKPMEDNVAWLKKCINYREKKDVS